MSRIIRPWEIENPIREPGHAVNPDLVDPRTLPISGPLSMSQINTEFGRGLNLGAYRGTPWYTADGQSGAFSSTDLDIAEFYGKTAVAPGVTEFSYLGNTNGSNPVDAGAENPNRYIVVGGGYRLASFNTAAAIRRLTLNGVEGTILYSANSADPLNQETFVSWLGWGLLPTGATVTAAAFNQNDNEVGYLQWHYRLVGANLRMVKEDGGSSAASWGPVPANSAIIAINTNDGDGFTGWNQLTAYHFVDQGGYRQGTGAGYWTTAQSTVNAASNQGGGHAFQFGA